MLLARLFESLPLVCPNCGADMHIIAFIAEAVPVEQILTHIGEPSRPPPIALEGRGLSFWSDHAGEFKPTQHIRRKEGRLTL